MVVGRGKGNIQSVPCVVRINTVSLWFVSISHCLLGHDEILTIGDG